MQPINVFDYETLAMERLDVPAWDFYTGGSEDEVTVRANRSAFERIRLRPRVLVNVSACDLQTSVLGDPVSMPILIAPVAGQGIAHPDGECATARAAGDVGTLMVVSTDSTLSLEDVAQAARGPLWFQLYIYTYDEARQLIRRAEEAGYEAIVLTVDAPRLGRRERDLRNDFQTYNINKFEGAFKGNANHLMGRSAGEEARQYIGDTLTWEVISWLRSETKLPLILKGIVTAEDAELALEHQVDAIIVSNHGGRQLDGTIASIDALPSVLSTVAGRCEVYLDGGIRRGTDILKALSLGARAVLIGRPVIWGLAADGQEGVRAVLEILHDELELAMILAGCPTVESITQALIMR
jgi:isopentenyl diphosphate isomerase/L-lactate dehydrogenase-like FMN-dependent dehydrogenase